MMRFLSNLPDDSATLDLRHVIEDEIPELDRLYVVTSDNLRRRYLLHDTGDALIFYEIERDSEHARVRALRIAPPKGARVEEVQLLRSQDRSAWLGTERLVATHESLPHGRIDCSAGDLVDEGAMEHARALFRSWL
jgi:hypothetical protein